MKSKYLKRLITLAVLAGSSTFAFGQFSVDGQLITRGEYRHGYKTLADSNQAPAAFTEQRTRLIFGYKGDNYKIGISFQDIRTWGSTAQNNKVDGLTSVHEAYVDWNACSKGSFKIGRQELVYDDHRIFGNVDWTMEARSHDIALFKFIPDTMTQLHVGLAWNQDAAQLTTNYYTLGSAASGFQNYKSMQFLWFNRRIGTDMNVSILALNNGLQYDWTDSNAITFHHVEFSQTAGANFVYKKDAMGFHFNAYYQMGNDGRYKQTDGITAKTLSAYEVAADFTYTVNKKYGVTIGGEMISGNSQTDTTKAYKNVNHAFNPFYGTNHKFNGYMDYFYVGNHTNNVGLINPYLKLKYDAEKYWVGLDVHYFMSAAPVLDVPNLIKTGKYEAMSSGLGTEIDLTYAYKISKQATIQAGYSHMLGTDTMKALKGGKTNVTSNWAYLMFAFKPTLFKEK
ncbi:alginate export family protein [soil metagenome]